MPLPPQAPNTFTSTTSSPATPSSTTTTSILGEPLPIIPFDSTLPSLLPQEISGISMTCCWGPKAPGKFWDYLRQKSQQMSLPSSSRPVPEGSPPNLPVLLPSSILPEDVSLLHLPGELELLSESMVESMIMESLNPPAFYTFLIPDEDGQCHRQDVKPWGGGMNGELQELGAYKASADSSDDSCLLACLETT